MSGPGPSVVFDTAPLWGAGTAVFDTDDGHDIGIALAKIPAGGTNAVSPVRAIMQVGDNPASRARIRYITPPAGFLGGGDTSYSSPAGAVAYEVILDGVSLGQATDTVTSGGGATQPTVTGITAAPTAATVAGGSTTNIAIAVQGTNSPPQTFTSTKISGAGSVSGGGITMPAANYSTQVGVFRFRSAVDTSYFVDVTLTVAALAIPPDPGGIDATKVPVSRIVVFEGNKRVVTFEGNKREVIF